MLKLNAYNDEATVKEKIISDAADDDGKAIGFPALKSCDGFEMM